MARYTVILDKNGTLTIVGNVGVIPQEGQDDEQIEAQEQEHQAHDWLLSEDLGPGRILSALAEVAKIDNEANTITATLTSPRHFAALRAFLNEHYDMKVTISNRDVYNFDAVRGEQDAQLKAGKPFMLDQIPRFSVSLGTDGTLRLQGNAESVEDFFTHWPFNGTAQGVRYEENKKIATVKLSTPEQYESLRQFVEEMRPEQILNKHDLLKQINGQKIQGSATTTTIVRSHPSMTASFSNTNGIFSVYMKDAENALKSFFPKHSITANSEGNRASVTLKDHNDVEKAKSFVNEYQKQLDNVGPLLDQIGSFVIKDAVSKRRGFFKE